MKIPWVGERCIICLEKGPLCEEHLIPDVLGGSLTSKFLCASCNSKFGHNVEATAKSDPSILLALKNLEGLIPKLAKRIIESHPHVGHSDPGRAPGYIRDGEFRVRSRKLEDESIVQPTDKARNSVVKILRKSGFEEAPIYRALKVFDEMPENKKTNIAPGLDVVKWTVDSTELDLSKAKLMDPLIPTKTAFEFIACLVETVIYENTPQLSEIRNALLKSLLNEEVIGVERLVSRKCEPFHGICFEGNDPYAKVQIKLFGCLTFRVHFFQLAIGVPRVVYIHRLDKSKEYLDFIDDENRS